MTTMKYQDVDNSSNTIDMRKSRNVNELLGVINRIKTSILTISSTAAKLKISRKVELGKAFDFQDVLDLLNRVEIHLGELTVARGLGNSIAYDGKRDSFFKVLNTVNSICLEVRGRIFDYMNNVGIRLESDKLAAFSSVVDKIMHGYEAASRSIVYIPQRDVLHKHFVFTEMVTDTGFTIPETIIRIGQHFTNGDYAYSVSFPDSVLAIDPVTNWFINTKELQSFLLENASLIKIKQRIRVPKNVLRIDGVSGVDSDNTDLLVTLEPGLMPKDIHGILSSILPIVQRAVGASKYDVLHRVMNNETGGKTIQFILAGRKIVDGQQAIAMRKALAMSRPSFESLCKALNHAKSK